jgi:polysaccharide deacetylase 2 family uncharacterized protein YibQ
MADGQKHGKSGKRPWGSVRPVFLAAGAVALLGFGIIFGATLDLATRPAPPPKPVAASAPAKPSQQPAPKVAMPPDPDDKHDSLFDHAVPPRPRETVDTTPAKPAPAAAFAVPADAPRQRPILAVVIDDMGLDRARAQKMMELQGPLTVSLMTYADNLPGLVELARKGGHEVMAHLPMEPIDPTENPGPGALRVNMDEATIRRVLGEDLNGWQGYVGINNHMGSKFTADKVRMAVVMDELKARGLLWLDSKTIGDSAGPATAAAAGVPYVERDVFLDNEETVEAVTKQLEQLLATAKSRGSAIGIGHPHDVTITALKRWLPKLEAEGVALVPVTAILKRRSAPPPRGE